MLMDDGLTYCGEVVRRYDSDRFLVSLSAAPERRAALWALFAFNHEIAKTREVVTETTIGLIRLQWWRDALGKIYEEDFVLQNEILPELYAAIKAHALPREEFDALVYAREFDLENVAPGSLEGLENYADFTHAPLLRLALRIAGQEEDGAVISAVAKGYAMTGLMRAAAFHAAQGRSFLPADLTAGEDEVAAMRAVMERAEALMRGAAPNGRLLRAVRAIGLLYAGQVRAAGYDAGNARLAAQPPFFHLRFLLKTAF